jgi:Sulfotransferase family
LSDDAPIVIGALGGSGTRVFAEALIEGGAHLGRELNRARDNLVFTALFRRPRWMERVGDAGVHRQLDTFVRYMRGRRYGVRDYLRLTGSLLDPDPENDLREIAQWVWGAVRDRPRGADAAAPVWGWKEPNTHVFLPQLIDHFAGLRYVYVARNGLDMAYTRNKTQLRVWGERFGVRVPAANGPDEARAQLEYWIAATRRATDLGRRLGERFALVRYDDLYREPERELRRVLELAGLTVDAERLARLAAGVRAPESAGRWRAHGADAFSAKQIEAVESFGFEVR